MRTQGSSGSNSSRISPTWRRIQRITSFFCPRCNKSFSNLQIYKHHKIVHIRQDMAMLIGQAYAHQASQSLRFQLFLEYRRRSQQFRRMPQFGNSITPTNSLVDNQNDQPPNFSSFSITDGVNVAHATVQRNMDFIPNPITSRNVPYGNYNESTRMMPFVGGVNGYYNRMGANINGANPMHENDPTRYYLGNIGTQPIQDVTGNTSNVDGINFINDSNVVDTGEAGDNPELDLELHL